MQMFVRFLIMFCALSLSSISSANEPIYIFGNDSKPPKNYVENKKSKGILINIMEYISEEIEQPFEYNLYPWKRAYLLAVHGEGGIIGLSKTESRMLIFDYSDVMFYDEILICVLKGNEFEYNEIGDLRGKTVGVIRGAVFGSEFETAMETKLFIVFETHKPAQRFNAL